MSTRRVARILLGMILVGLVWSCTLQAQTDIFADARQLGRGINLGNTLESPREGEWGFVLEPEHFQTIAAGGFDSVRVPIRWSSHAADSAPYTIDAKFFARIDWVLKQAQTNGLAVVLDMHHYDELTQDPAGHRDRFVSLWQQIATHYKNQPRTVFFELLNEPNDYGENHLDAATWNTLLADGLKAIRETNPDRPVIIGPAMWNNWRELKSLALPQDDNLILTVHYYEPMPFTHQGAVWVPGAEAWVGTTWEGSEAQQQEVLQAFDTTATWAKEHHRPVYLGEFGTIDKGPLEDRARWTAFVRQTAEARGFAWAYWEFGAGFGAYDRTKRAWIEPLHKALVPVVSSNQEQQ